MNTEEKSKKLVKVGLGIMLFGLIWTLGTCMVGGAFLMMGSL